MFKDLAIVVHTMDNYEFCWYGWYKTFSKYWDFNLDIDIYFANENKDINFENIKQIKTGVGEFSDRLTRAFNSIPHKHVIYWQEDMWMLKKLENLTEHYQDFIKYEMDCLLMMVEQVNQVENYFQFHEDILDDKYLKFNIETSPLVILHQPGIWKKEFFLKYLRNCEDPWVNEYEATKRVREDNKIKEVKIYNIHNKDYWYTSVVNKGEFSSHAASVLNGTFQKPQR
jgi:hypothetical protein